MRHILGLSGGKDSTALAVRLRELNPSVPYEYVITPTGNELPPMFEHWRKLGEMLGSPLLPVGRKTLEGEIEKQRALPNWRQRWCTRLIKIEEYARYLSTVTPCVSYVGLRADEMVRQGGVYDHVAGVTMCFPLREWGWGIREVTGYLAEKGIVIPKRTDCALCFFQRLGEWWDLWREHPEEWAKGEAIEAKYNHTFRSPGRDTWPAGMRELRAEFEAGRIPRGRQTDQLADAKCRVCSM